MRVGKYAGWVGAATLGVVSVTGIAYADAPFPDGPSSETVTFNNDRRPLRLAPRKVMHGELVVETKDGTREVLVQRGTVTSIGDSELGVMSSDGYAVEWIINEATRVHRHGDESTLSDLDSGDMVWVLGADTGGGGGTARVIRTGER